MSPTQDVFLIRLTRLQPSQLMINAEKLALWRSRIEAADPFSVSPIPVKRLDGDRVMMDGHSRGLAAHLSGLDELPVYWETDDLDWDAYRICVGWCKKAGINTIPDLANRVVPPDVYQARWLDRCGRMQRKLAAERRNH